MNRDKNSKLISLLLSLIKMQPKRTCEYVICNIDRTCFSSTYTKLADFQAFVDIGRGKDWILLLPCLFDVSYPYKY